MGTYLHQAYENSIIKFSIIVPVYNVEKFLRQCLDSIASQTLKEFEVICINDGSTDNSLEILNEYATKDKRFIVLSQENQGQGIARNKCIELAKGEYIVFVDPDDFIEFNALEIIYNKFRQTDVDMIQFDYESCKENGKFSRYKIFKKQVKKYFHCSIKDNEIYNWHNISKKNLQDMWMAIWNKAYKTAFVKSNNIKMAPNKHGEDHIFSISANLLAKKILYINKSLYHYRTRLGSAVNKASNDNFCIFQNIELLKNFLVEQNLFDEYEDSFNNYVVEVLSWHYVNIPTESMERYLKMCKELLNTQDYKLFIKKTKGNFSPIEKVFSIKNQKVNGVKIKVVTILGIPFKIKHKKENNG